MHDVGDLRSGKSHRLQFLHVAEHLARLSVQHNASMVHHDDAAHIVRHILHAVGNQNHGHSCLFPQRGDLSQNLIPPSRIQPGGGLVQNQHIRVHGEHTCDGNPSFLSAGQVKGRLIIIFLSDSHQLQRPPRPLFHLFFRKTQVFGAETDVRKYVDFKKLIFGILKNKTDSAAQLLQIVSLFVDIRSIITDLSVRRLQKAVQMLHQR